MFAGFAAVIAVIPIALGQPQAGTSESITLTYGPYGIVKNVYTTNFIEDLQNGLVYQDQIVPSANYVTYFVQTGEKWNRCFYFAVTDKCQCDKTWPFVRKMICDTLDGELSKQRTIGIGPYSFNVTEIYRSKPTRTIYCTKDQIPVFHEYFNFDWKPPSYSRVFTTAWYQPKSNLTLPEKCNATLHNPGA